MRRAVFTCSDGRHLVAYVGGQLQTVGRHPQPALLQGGRVWLPPCSYYRRTRPLRLALTPPNRLAAPTPGTSATGARVNGRAGPAGPRTSANLPPSRRAKTPFFSRFFFDTL